MRTIPPSHERNPRPRRPVGPERAVAARMSGKLARDPLLHPSAFREDLAEGRRAGEESSGPAAKRKG
jgi:hypothetical protein